MSFFRSSTFKKAMAVVGTAGAIVVGFDYVTYAATGSALILGVHNTETTPTYVINNGAGAPLVLVAHSPAFAPFATNARGMVTNLNANMVGGLTAAQLAPGSIVYQDGAASQSGNKTYAPFTVPAGTWLMSFDAAVSVNNNGTAISAAAPAEMYCWVGGTSLFAPVLGEASTTTIGSGFTSLSFTRVLTLSVPTTLQLACNTDRGAGYNNGVIFSTGLMPTLSFTKIGATTAHPLS